MKFSSFLEDESGGFSSTRLAFLLWVVGVLAVYIYQRVHSDRPVVIDGSVITIIGILMTGKVVQRFGEKPELPAGTTPPATSQAGK